MSSLVLRGCRYEDVYGHLVEGEKRETAETMSGLLQLPVDEPA